MFTFSLNFSTVHPQWYLAEGEYLLWVKTCKDSKPPKGSKAVLTVYAERGKSTDIELGLDKGSFEPGNTDEFQIAIGDLGPPYKIRIGRREKDRWAGWHLQEVSSQEVCCTCCIFISLLHWCGTHRVGSMCITWNLHTIVYR